MFSLSRGQQFVLLAVFLFSLMGVIVKWLSDLPTHQVVFLRALVSLAMTAPLLAWARIQPLGVNRKLLFARGLVGTAGLFIFFYTLTKMPLASAYTLQQISPLFTIFIAGIWHRQDGASPKQWALFLLAFFGVALVQGFDPRVSLGHAGLGILGAVASGFAYNFVRELKRTDHPLVVTFYFPLVACIVIGPYSLFHWTPPTPVEWLLLVILGIITFLAQWYITIGIQMDSVARTSPLIYVGAIFSLSFGYLIFEESMPALALLGILVILVSLALAQNLKTPRSEPPLDESMPSSRP
ncbi:MAG: DMT family transporter [Bradymonadales bacterium]|nr:MAG: DMT family transporter [Bradymonadales bacterium]